MDSSYQHWQLTTIVTSHLEPQKAISYNSRVICLCMTFLWETMGFAGVPGCQVLVLDDAALLSRSFWDSSDLNFSRSWASDAEFGGQGETSSPTCRFGRR